MESGFTSDTFEFSDSTWQRIPHRGSGRFEFFKVRLFGAMHFVKRPSPRYAHDLQTTESLRKEFNIGYNLSHPGLAKYLRMENGAVFQEYIDGLSLQQMIVQDDIRLRSPEFLERMCRQLLEVTAYLHSHGVVHNDIKPDNVMITRIDDHVKLVDLGCASSDTWNATDGYTEEYKAPEQGVGPTNTYTDIFLVGKLMEKIVPNAKVERRWKRFIGNATAEDVEKRFKSDKESLVAIPKKSRDRWMGVAAIAVFILMSVIGISIFWSHHESDENLSSENIVDSLSTRDYALTHSKIEAEEMPQPNMNAASETHSSKKDEVMETTPVGLQESEADEEEQSLLPNAKIKVPSPDEKSMVAAPGIQSSLPGQLNSELGKKSDSSYKELSYSQKSSLLRNLNDQMDKYIKGQYEKNLLPDCRKYAAMPLNYDKCRFDVRLNLSWDKVVKDVTGYVERLASEHPELAGEILQDGYSIVEREQLRANSIKYPKGEEVEAAEKFKKLKNDSLFEIYHNYNPN